MRKEDESALNLGDSQLSKLLPIPLPTASVPAFSAEVKHLAMLAVTHHLSLNPSAIHVRHADFHISAFADEKHRQLNPVTRIVLSPKLHANHITLPYSGLSAASLYNCVHAVLQPGSGPGLMLNTEPTLLLPGPQSGATAPARKAEDLGDYWG